MFIFYNLNETVVPRYRRHYFIFNFVYVQKSSNLLKMFLFSDSKTKIKMSFKFSRVQHVERSLKC